MCIWSNKECLILVIYLQSPHIIIMTQDILQYSGEVCVPAYSRWERGVGTGGGGGG